MTDQQPNENLELATAQRLRHLSTMPVDLTNLEQRIKATIPHPTAEPSHLRISRFRTKPLIALAASILLLLTATTYFITTSARPVLASPQMLEQIYQNPDGSGVMACCVKKVEGKAVTCFSIDVNGKRVSMAVGDAKHFKVPDEAGRRIVAGTEYRFQSSGHINMVMAIKNGAWLCLMGEPSVDELIAQLEQHPAAPAN